MIQEIMMTESGLNALKEELEYLKVTGRQEIKEKIQVALSFGDLSENAEYDEARNDQGKLEARISELEQLMNENHNSDIISEYILKFRRPNITIIRSFSMIPVVLMIVHVFTLFIPIKIVDRGDSK